MLYRSIHWNLNLVYPPEAPITLYQVRDESQEEVTAEGIAINALRLLPPFVWIFHPPIIRLVVFGLPATFGWRFLDVLDSQSYASSSEALITLCLVRDVGVE